jgi:hypothetical protein
MTRRLWTACAAFAALACSGGRNAPTGAPAPVAGTKLYVVNQTGASITVIDQQRLAVDTVIDLTAMGFSATAKPHHIAVEPNGSAWYVSLIGDGKVLKFGRDNRLLGQVSMETPGLLALDPIHDSLYVGRSMTAVNPPKSLGVIHRAATYCSRCQATSMSCFRSRRSSVRYSPWRSSLPIPNTP